MSHPLSQLWTTEYAWLWLRAFLWTQAVEAPIYRRFARTSWRDSLLPSTITHPFVWFAFPWLRLLPGVTHFRMTVLAELFAVLVEALFLRYRTKRPFPELLGVSFLANGASVAVGEATRWLIGFP
jgi:hypothetical protein